LIHDRNDHLEEDLRDYNQKKQENTQLRDEVFRLTQSTESLKDKINEQTFTIESQLSQITNLNDERSQLQQTNDDLHTQLNQERAANAELKRQLRTREKINFSSKVCFGLSAILALADISLSNLVSGRKSV
jgi:predicted RNase H-like nuclease (RuvC/YqgF family)